MCSTHWRESQCDRYRFSCSRRSASVRDGSRYPSSSPAAYKSIRYCSSGDPSMRLRKLQFSWRCAGDQPCVFADNMDQSSTYRSEFEDLLRRQMQKYSFPEFRGKRHRFGRWSKGHREKKVGQMAARYSTDPVDKCTRHRPYLTSRKRWSEVVAWSVMDMSAWFLAKKPPNF